MHLVSGETWGWQSVPGQTCGGRVPGGRRGAESHNWQAPPPAVTPPLTHCNLKHFTLYDLVEIWGWECFWDNLSQWNVTSRNKTLPEMEAPTHDSNSQWSYSIQRKGQITYNLKCKQIKNTKVRIRVVLWKLSIVFMLWIPAWSWPLVCKWWQISWSNSFSWNMILDWATMSAWREKTIVKKMQALIIN